MSIFGGVVTFIVVWWIVLFMVLPFGIKSQIESDANIVKGTDIGSPKKPNLKTKFLITTLIAFLIWSSGFLLFYMNIISINDFL